MCIRDSFLRRSLQSSDARRPGQRYRSHGFYQDAWTNGGADWHRTEVPAARVARISPEFLAQERRALGESWFRQEYCCSFEALQGVVYPDFARCVVPAL